MKITRLLTNRMENPLGFDLGIPSLSFEVSETDAARRKSARIVVAKDESFSSPVYDSGDRADLDRLDFELPFRPEPETRYFWKAGVTADNGESAESAPAWFETPREGRWKGTWIAARTDRDVQVSVFRTFRAAKPVRSARLTGVGLGAYELYLNGEKQGAEYLMPGLNDYSSWIQYQTYALELRPGENCVSFLLGNGWYKGLYGLNLKENNFGDRLACIADLVIRYEDGTEEIIGTDESWKARRNGIVTTGIYNGEALDLCMDTSEIFGTETMPLGLSRLRPRLSPRITAHERLEPALLHTPAGETVFDMGQNMVGWISCRDRQPKGTRVLFQFGEILQDGNFYNANLRSAKAEFSYRSDGEGREVRPYFTFFGFRYVKVSGFRNPIAPEDITGVVIHSEMETIGTLETSDPLVNRLIENIRWGQKGNFLDVPTDCPQRDERMGWTGDAQMFSGTACYQTDPYEFYTKFGYDLFCEQSRLDGSVPFVVPTVGYRGDGATAWGEAATIIPWNVYLHSGKKGILRRQYPSMKAWVDTIKRRDDADGAKRLWQCGFHFGDWLALDGPVKGGVYGATDPHFIASAYYFYSAQIVGKAAAVLGYEEDARSYSALAEEIRSAFRKEYFTPSGRLSVNTMTACVLSLFFGLVPENALERTRKNLLDQMRTHQYHLVTGFVGTPYLCRALSENGMNGIAYHLLLEKGYPGWLYEVLMGATTVWERWNSVLPDGHISGTEMNSLNHYAYGSIAEWMYRDMAGIRPTEEGPGFRKAVIAPQPDYRIPRVSCTLRSAAGLYRVEWQLEGRKFTLRVTVPFDSQARVVLPDTQAGGVRVSVRRGAAPAAFTQQGCGAAAEFTAGEYEITCELRSGFRRVFTINTPVEELIENDAAREILEQDFFSRMTGTIDAEKERKSIGGDIGFALAAYRALPFAKETPALADLMNSPFVAVPQEVQRAIDAKLRAVE